MSTSTWRLSRENIEWNRQFNAEATAEADARRETREAALRARDAAYRREFGSSCGRPRGRLTVAIERPAAFRF